MLKKIFIFINAEDTLLLRVKNSPKKYLKKKFKWNVLFALILDYNKNNSKSNKR